MTRFITKKHYNMAYDLGRADAKNGHRTSWYTQALYNAYELGMDGIIIDWDDIVECRRAGGIGNGVSWNHLDGRSERGLSVLNVVGEKEVSSAIWFSDRGITTVTGIRLPFKGSDGETLILPFGIDQFDF